MTRPEIIRADTIDLQGRGAHSTQSYHSSTYNQGPLAPHQAETLREVAAETAEESLHSPRVSWSGGEAGGLHNYANDPEIHVGQAHDNLQHQIYNGGGNNMASRSHQDSLAIAQNGGHSDFDDGDIDGDNEIDEDDDGMDKISSSPSIEDEDIDFEFVYALHTFVATVEGQANATKGDTMVLLDDSNSYWWLVRVVKDSSIGYLPAEHIETPTERLARLNKHRNIDLSATMLGDQSDKPRNPIMSAMKRTKRKTVQFTAPTYVDYSDIDYSTEEEDLEAEYFGQQQQAQKTQQSNVQQIEPDTDPEDETAKVEPLKPRPLQTKDSKTGEDSAGRPGIRNSEEIFDSKPSEGPKKSSDGNVRDSFFKDDVETKKITLTPNLLRDDSTTRTPSDSVQLKQRPSLDKLEKDSPTSKDDKKRKEKENSKKPSAIRSFFSRKDKKKGQEDDDSHGKSSHDADGHDREHEEDDQNILSSPERAPAPQRNPSKLQKSQPTNAKPIAGILKDTSMDSSNYMSASRINNVSNTPPSTMRLVEPEPADTSITEGGQQEQRGKQEQSPEASRKQGSVDHSRDAGPQQLTQTQPRSGMDFDSDDEDDDTMESAQEPPAATQEPHRQQERSAPTSRNPFATVQPTVSSVAPSQLHAERLSESPVHVSPTQADQRTSPTPPLMADSSSQEDRASPRLTPSPELIEHDDGADDKDIAPPSPVSTTTPTWNDANLRAFFDSGSEIRDMLVVVYDKSDVEPVGPDHPIAGSLFKEQNAKLAEITTQLDNMLGDWLARKQRLRATV